MAKNFLGKIGDKPRFSETDCVVFMLSSFLRHVYGETIGPFICLAAISKNYRSLK
jgi:hypothetical protein